MRDIAQIRKQYNTISHCLCVTMHGEASEREEVRPGDAYRLLGDACGDVYKLTRKISRLCEELVSLRRQVDRLKAERDAAYEKIEKIRSGEINEWWI